MPNPLFQSGYCLAEVKYIKLRGKNISEGAEVGLNFPEINQFMKYYLKHVQKDQGYSIISFTYSTTYLWTPGERYEHRRLSGRFLRPYVIWKFINGKNVPVITHFTFSQRELFGMNGHH